MHRLTAGILIDTSWSLSVIIWLPQNSDVIVECKDHWLITENHYGSVNLEVNVHINAPFNVWLCYTFFLTLLQDTSCVICNTKQQQKHKETYKQALVRTTKWSLLDFCIACIHYTTIYNILRNWCTAQIYPALYKLQQVTILALPTLPHRITQFLWAAH